MSDEELDDSALEKGARASYVSPLLQKVDSTRLTVELLRELVPVVQEGQSAADKLSDASSNNEATKSSTHRELHKKVRDGERAKEALFNAALPLIRTIAQKEYRRRQQWGSQIPMDDLMQDAIIGFFKGLRIFDTSAINKSATNYLGQWMLSEMRRAAEAMDHDLQVGHDAGERYRRIRAIRSRLASELGREPTDEEIVEASKKPEYVVRPGMVGKATNAKNHSIKGLTLEQVQDEKENRERVGSTARFSSSSSESDEGSDVRGNLIDIERAVNANEIDPQSNSNDPEIVIGSLENLSLIHI